MIQKIQLLLYLFNCKEYILIFKAISKIASYDKKDNFISVVFRKEHNIKNSKFFKIFLKNQNTRLQITIK